MALASIPERLNRINLHVRFSITAVSVLSPHAGRLRLESMFRVMSPFAGYQYANQRSTGSLHKAVFSNYGWHISITIAMFVNTKPGGFT